MSAADDAYRARIPTLLADYEALGRLPSWRPYLMFFHAPNFRSASVNTDEHGFRLGTAAGDAGGPCALLVGNSVSFGVGASSDDASLAARLGVHTGIRWHNFGGRAFGGLQEWLLFHGHRHTVGPVRDVVLFTGLNDLVLHYVPRDADPMFGVAFYGDRFRRAMETSSKPDAQDASGRVLVRALGRRIAQRVRTGGRAPQPPSPDYVSLAAADVRAREASRGEIIERIERQLAVWKSAADAQGFRLTYALQPLWPWLQRTPPAVERESVETYDANSPWHALVNAVIDDEHRAWYVPRLADACAGLGIPFVDMNVALAESAPLDEWLFLDRIHLTDRGQDRCAAIVAELVDSP